MPQSKYLVTLLITLLVSCVAGFAQARRQQRPAVSDFNIEVIGLDNRTHIFSVPESPGKASYIAHIDLKRIPEWKISADVPAETGALHLQFWIEAGVPQIEVTAYLGKVEPDSRPYEWDKLAASRVALRPLRPDETITISETERFGIVPFQVKVARAQPWNAGPPTVKNKTQALSVSAVADNRPFYILSLRNVSHKTINAIHWHGVENGNKVGGSGMSGLPLIVAGGAFELRQRFGFMEEKPKAEGSALSPLEREIVIEAIVFDDETFEGAPDVAAEMAANMTGDRIQLLRINRLFGKLSEGALRDPEQLKKLKSDVVALSEEVDPTVINELVLRFAEASADMRNRRIKEEVANGLRSTKNHVLRQLEKLESRRDDPDFDGRLKELLNDFGKKPN